MTAEYDELMERIEKFLGEQEGPIGGLVITFSEEPLPRDPTIGLLGHPNHDHLALGTRLHQHLELVVGRQHHRRPQMLEPMRLGPEFFDFSWPEKICDFTTPDKTKDWENKGFIPKSGSGNYCGKELTDKQRAKRKRERQARKKNRR